MYLTPRESKVVSLLIKGYDNEEIAKELCIAKRTVKSHFNRMYIKFGVTSGVKKVKLVRVLFEKGFICLKDSEIELSQNVNVPLPCSLQKD